LESLALPKYIRSTTIYNKETTETHKYNDRGELIQVRFVRGEEGYLTDYSYTDNVMMRAE